MFMLQTNIANLTNIVDVGLVMWKLNFHKNMIWKSLFMLIGWVRVEYCYICYGEHRER